MQETLSQEELKRIKNLQNYSQAYYWLKVKEDSNFNLGDILVKMCVKKWGEDGEATSYEAESVSSKSNTPRKYKVVYIDQYSVPFAKCIKADGKLGKELICLAEINPQYNFFKVDPDYVEHTILADEGEVFVADQRLKEVKRQRREIHKQNKALREKITTLNEADKFLESLKPRDRFWIADKGNDDSAFISEYKVKEIAKTTAQKTVNSWYSNTSRSSKSSLYKSNTEIDELTGAGLTQYHEVYFVTVNKTNVNSTGHWGWYDKWLDPHAVLQSYIYRKQPNSYETKIK